MEQHHSLPVVPARGGAEVALKIYIYKTFLIYRTCMRRAPAKPVRACTLRNWCLVSHVTFEAPLHTSHLTVFTLHTTHFTLHSSHCTLPTANSTLHTSQSTLHTSHSTLHTSHSTLHTPHSTLHTALFTPHTSHCTLHTPHFISSELFSPYPSSSLLIPSLLRTQTQPLVAEHRGGTNSRMKRPSRTRRTHEVPFIAGCSHFTRKNTRFRAPASSSPQGSQCNLDAAIPMRPIHNQRFKKRIELRTQTQPLVAEHRGGTNSRMKRPSRTRRTHEVPFIAGCSHFTRKNTRFRAPASSPQGSPCNLEAAIPMRSTTRDSRNA